MKTREIEIGKTYKHFKGNLYKVLCIACDSETLNKKVVYEALYGEHKIWVRDYLNFASLVDKELYPLISQKYRFEIVNNDN